MSDDRVMTRPVIAWVDDDSHYRTLVSEWLRPRYEVREYGDAESFLASLQDGLPDAVILDVGLPGMDGFTLCENARQRGLSTPVLFLTASREQEDFLRHMELDAAAYLTKPVGKNQLLACLSELVDGERAAAITPWKSAPGWLPTSARSPARSFSARPAANRSPSPPDAPPA